MPEFPIKTWDDFAIAMALLIVALAVGGWGMNIIKLAHASGVLEVLLRAVGVVLFPLGIFLGYT